LPQLIEGAHRPVIIELTEHERIDDYAAIRSSFARLGPSVRLAVDDAGSGWASLHHIIELHPDIIKIDRSLIHGLPGDRSRQTVVRALVTIAEDIAATVIAEGVETADELDVVKSLGVQAAQGYYLARPNADPTAAAERGP